jgi:lysophospholipase L1-like esterase
MKQTIALAFLALALASITPAQAEIPIKSGEKLAFLGDSITAAGKSNPGGYVNLVSNGLATNGVKIEVIGAGISGHKSNQMLGRLENDVLKFKPQWMTLSCGVNDVWHGEKGVPLEDYKKNITSIVDQAQAAGVKVILLTSTMIGEDQANPNNQKLIPYNDFLRSLAKEKKCLLADLNADMQAAVSKANTPGKNALTGDGVHMVFPGDVMMATGILKALGLDDKQLAKAQDAWLDLPNTASVKLNATFSQREMQQLEKAAAARNTTAQKMVDEEVKKVLDSLKK